MASRGKPKVRDLSRQKLTDEEAWATYEAFRDGVPVVTALFGQALLEHELETLLQRKFKRQDDSTWGRLISENGPLGTFAAKIIAGHAFAIYDDDMMTNLNIVRDIRNAFAHTKRHLTFAEGAIVQRLQNIALPRAKTSIAYRNLSDCKKKADKDPRDAFVLLCQELYLMLLKSRTRSALAAARNYKRTLKRRRQENPYLSAFLLGLNPPNNLLSFPPNRTDDPKDQAPK